MAVAKRRIFHVGDLSAFRSSEGCSRVFSGHSKVVCAISLVGDTRSFRPLYNRRAVYSRSLS